MKRSLFSINWILKTAGILLLCSTISAQMHAQHMGHHGIHPALGELMATSKMTHTATQSGDWSQPDTWGGNPPSDNARVYIPKGISVVVDGVIPSRFKHIRVDGELRFATDRNTELKVETLATWPMSRLIVGTESDPIQANVSARILLIDNGLLDFSEDYELLGRAVIPQGMVRFHGQQKTTWLQAAEWLPSGSNQVTLQSAPDNWQVGDRVVLSGTFSEEQEVFNIAAINGAIITFDRPTANNRTIASSHPAFRDQYPYLANYTRNIIIESENKGRDLSSIPHRGHLMFMHTQDVIFKYVQLEELGRTDKSREFVRTENLTSSTDNSIARYALHFHRAGDMNPNAQFGLVEGCALWGSPGWGFVNHESSVWFKNNASYHVFGSHFTDENGTEMGGFIDNIAIYSIGSVDYAGGFTEKKRTPGDHGHSGVGFWATSGGTVRWEGNVATDHNMSGYAIISRRIPRDAHDYDLSLHDNPEIDNGEGLVSPKIVGINFFRNNVNHGGNSGLVTVDLELNGRLNTDNLIENFTVMNTKRDGLSLEYMRNLHLKNVKIIRDDALKTGRWSGGSGVSAKGTWDHFFRHQTKGWSYFENSIIYNYNDAFDLQRGDSPQEDQDSKMLIFDDTEIIIANQLVDNPNYIKEGVNASDIPQRPVLSVKGGTYGDEFSVSLHAESGTDIYYSTDNDYGWRLRGEVTYPLIISDAFKYQGEAIPIQRGKKTAIYAIAVKNGIHSRVVGGIYEIEDGAPLPSIIEDAIPNYTLTVETHGEGTVEGAGSYQQDSLASLLATPSEGWLFSGWSGDTTSTQNPLSFAVKRDYQITAHFSESPKPEVGICLEAEHSTYNHPMMLLEDTKASSGQYLEVATGKNAYKSPPAKGHATYTFQVADSGSYRLWGRIIAPSGGDDSFWVKVNEGEWVRWNNIARSQDWTWDEVHDADNGNQVMQYALLEGTHQLHIAYREDGAKLDKLYFTKKGDTPTDEAQDCGTNLANTHGISVELLGEGAIEGVGAYPEGSLATLRAVPEEGWLFSGWSGDTTSTVNPLNILIHSDKHISATFSRDLVYFTGVCLEAEQSMISSPMQVVNDTEALGGAYIEVTAGNNSLRNVPAEGHATFSVEITHSGTYILWGRVLATSGGNDSFWVKVNEGAWTRWNSIAKSQNWLWDEVHDADNRNARMQYTLGKGTHQLIIAYREDGTKLDKLYFTKEGDTPTDEFQACSSGEMMSSNQKMRMREEIDVEKESIAAEELPTETELFQNYPNPFNPGTQINYALNEATNVSLVVYNLSGQLVSRLVQGNQNPGNYSVYFNASNLPTGVYLYRLTTNQHVQTKKMLLIK